MSPSEVIHNEVCDATGIKKSLVVEAIQSMFDYVVEHMENGDLTPIRMQYMGLWQCKPLRIQKLKERGLL